MTYRDDSLGMPLEEASCYPQAFWTFNSEDNATEIKKVLINILIMMILSAAISVRRLPLDWSAVLFRNFKIRDSNLVTNRTGVWGILHALQINATKMSYK